MALSKPTHSPDEQRQLFKCFRAFGFEGLQLKGGQYAGYLGDPGSFIRKWGDDWSSQE